MTEQNKSTNSKKVDNKDTSTYSAYGDPLSDTPSAMNKQYKKATSPIAESTQSVSSGRINPDTKKSDTSAFGDPMIDNSNSTNNNYDDYKLANSTIAKSTQNNNSDLHV